MQRGEIAALFQAEGVWTCSKPRDLCHLYYNHVAFGRSVYLAVISGPLGISETWPRKKKKKKHRLKHPWLNAEPGRPLGESKECVRKSVSRWAAASGGSSGFNLTICVSRRGLPVCCTRPSSQLSQPSSHTTHCDLALCLASRKPRRLKLSKLPD